MRALSPVALARLAAALMLVFAAGCSVRPSGFGGAPAAHPGGQGGPGALAGSGDSGRPAGDTDGAAAARLTLSFGLALEE